MTIYQRPQMLFLLVHHKFICNTNCTTHKVWTQHDFMNIFKREADFSNLDKIIETHQSADISSEKTILCVTFSVLSAVRINDSSSRKAEKAIVISLLFICLFGF